MKIMQVVVLRLSSREVQLTSRHRLRIGAANKKDGSALFWASVLLFVERAAGSHSIHVEVINENRRLVF